MTLGFVLPSFLLTLLIGSDLSITSPFSKLVIEYELRAEKNSSRRDGRSHSINRPKQFSSHSTLLFHCVRTRRLHRNIRSDAHAVVTSHCSAICVTRGDARGTLFRWVIRRSEGMIIVCYKRTLWIFCLWRISVCTCCSHLYQLQLQVNLRFNFVNDLNN